MTAATERLAEIEGRADGATAGPWRAWDPEDRAYNPSVTRGAQTRWPDEGNWIAEAGPVAINGTHDAIFIAHARTDVPRMAEALRAVLALHYLASATIQRSDGPYIIDGCHECIADDYPCPTVTAITAALSVSEEGK